MEPPAVGPRHRAMHTVRIAPLAAVIVLGLALAACASGGSSPATSPGPSAAPSGPPTPGLVTTAERAAAAAAATNPLLAGIGPLDPDMIGQSAWWEAQELDTPQPPGAWQVTFTVGWGDCQAGCIERHVWTYEVAADGTVTLTGESGTPLTNEVINERLASAATSGVAGRAVAGPTCPVEVAGAPCESNPVAGAVLVVTGAGDVEVARVTTDASGLFGVDLQPGDYVLVPEPVEGLMGTAAPIPFTVVEGGRMVLDVAYDTGIR